MARTTFDHPSWLCVAALCLFGTACGDEKAGPREPDSSMSDDLGGIDGAGLGAPQFGNTSPDGPVVTTLGDFMVDVRSRRLLIHRLDTAWNRLYLWHTVQMPNQDNLRFELDYAGGSDSFSISDLGGYQGDLKDRNGWLIIQENGQELIARAGTVSIEPTGANITVTFSALGVIPYEPLVPEDSSQLRLIGDGTVSGPLQRECSGGVAETQPLFPPPLDDEEIEDFCRGDQQ